MSNPNTAIFPNTLATDLNLPPGTDNYSSSLTSGITNVATSIPVAAVPANFPCIITIDNEEILITNATGLNLNVFQRGYNGTAAASHNASAVVNGNITSWHLNQAFAEIKSIQAQLTVPLNFTAQTPGGSLTSGITNTITLSPVPAGVNGTDTHHYLYISGGTGTAEAVLITGGTATAGSSTGTITFVPANNHSGAWTIGSATAGIKEAQVNLGTNGGIIQLPAGIITTHASIIIDNVNSVILRGAGRESTQLTADLAVTPIIQFGDFANSIIAYSSGCENMMVTRAAGTIPANSIGVYYNNFARGICRNAMFLQSYYNMEAANSGVGLTLTDVAFGRSSFAHLFLNSAIEIYGNNLEFGINAEGTTNVPTYLMLISGATNTVQVANGRFLGPGGAPAQYAFGFTNLTGAAANAYFTFTNCNFESINQLIFSDASVNGEINYITFVNCRITGNAGSPAAAINLNAATILTQWQFIDCIIGSFSSFNLTNCQYLMIQNCVISCAQTYTGGGVATLQYTNNVSSSNVIFTGAFNGELVIGGNFNTGGTFSFSGVTGNLNVFANKDTSVSGNYVIPGSLITGNGPNFIPEASETGANNALVATLTNCNIVPGTIINIQIAHTLQAGANTLNFNAEGAVAIKSHLNPANNIATGYVVGSVLTLVRVTTPGQAWVDMSQ